MNTAAPQPKRRRRRRKLFQRRSPVETAARVAARISPEEAATALHQLRARVEFPDPTGAARQRRFRWARANPVLPWEAAYKLLCRLKCADRAVRALLRREAIQANPEPSRNNRRSRLVRRHLGAIGFHRARRRQKPLSTTPTLSTSRNGVPPDPCTSTSTPPLTQRVMMRGDPPRAADRRGWLLLGWKDHTGRVRRLPKRLGVRQLEWRLGRKLTESERERCAMAQEAAYTISYLRRAGLLEPPKVHGRPCWANGDPINAKRIYREGPIQPRWQRHKEDLCRFSQAPRNTTNT